MATHSKGERLRRNPKTDAWEKRLRLCGKKPLLPLPGCVTEQEAQKREAILLKLASQLTATNVSFDLARLCLRRVAIATSDLSLADAIRLIEDRHEGVLGGWDPTKKDRIAPTVDALFKRWQSNELAKAYKDLEIKFRCPKTVDAAQHHYDNYTLTVIGHLPVDEVTLEQCDRIKLSVAHMGESDSRRQALQHLKQILDIAVKLGYLKSSPLPEGWMPKRASANERRKLQFLYPSEEALLVAGFTPEDQVAIRTGTCASLLKPAVAFEWRFLWGFYVRQARRRTEVTLIELRQITWRRGRAIIQLRSEQCKNSKAFAWVLDEPSTRALRIYCALCRKDAKPTDRLFVTPEGRPINPESIDLPALLRSHLWAVGVRRPELHATVPGESRQIVVHDLRATRVTVMDALGIADNEIKKLTGHERSDTVHLYKRGANAVAMFEEGDFAPFDRALPELCEPGTFRLPELLDDQAPSEVDLPAWLTDASHGAPAALPAAIAPIAALPANTPTTPAQSTGQSLATVSRKPRETGGEPYSIVECRTASEPLDIAENPVVSQAVVCTSPLISEPAGHLLASMQAQLDALRAVVVGGLAAEVSRQVLAQLQAAGGHKQVKRARKAKR